LTRRQRFVTLMAFTKSRKVETRVETASIVIISMQYGW